MQPIPLARPTLGEEEAAAARRAILSGWVIQGPEVAAFEKEFAALVGAPLAVACASGTAALHLALLALDLKPGDEVITVSSSFIATANAVRYLGATPVFVDVELETGNLNPDLIEAAVSERTRAILAVHQLGLPCDLGGIAYRSPRGISCRWWKTRPAPSARRSCWQGAPSSPLAGPGACWPLSPFIPAR